MKMVACLSAPSVGFKSWNWIDENRGSEKRELASLNIPSLLVVLSPARAVDTVQAQLPRAGMHLSCRLAYSRIFDQNAIGRLSGRRARFGHPVPPPGVLGDRPLCLCQCDWMPAPPLPSNCKSAPYIDGTGPAERDVFPKMASSQTCDFG